MKKLHILLAIIFTATATFSQPCLPKGIIFTTQAQIDSFQINFPNCTEIEGSVQIYGNDITNLNGLNDLTSIGGTMQIGNNINMTGANPVLVSLEGLSSLSAVDGDLRILGNDIIVDLSGLESLTSIGGSLVIGDWWHTFPCANLSLLSLDGLDNLAFVGDGIQILGGGPFGYGVEDISALSSLTSINGNVYIRYVPNLQSLVGFNNISSIGGNLSLLSLGLIDLSGLDNLTSIAGGFKLNRNDPLISLIGLSQLDSILGDLSISDNNILETLSGFDNLTSIGGNLRVSFNDFLSSFIGLGNLTSVDGDLLIGTGYLGGNPLLTSLEGAQ